ncbi:MAG: preprotein translocase subunit SecA, partial [Chthoniobacterales bacterium]
MINFIIRKIVGSKNQREVRRMMPTVRKINELEQQYQSLSDDDLRAKTAEWKTRISVIEDFQEQQKALDEVLPEAFAVVKNTARRLCGRTTNVVDHPIEWQMVH